MSPTELLRWIAQQPERWQRGLVARAVAHELGTTVAQAEVGLDGLAEAGLAKRLVHAAGADEVVIYRVTSAGVTAARHGA